MDNLIFSLNATMPLFLLMVLGALFRKIGWMSETFANQLNNFVFKVCLPVKVFYDLAVSDFSTNWDTKFVIFCALVTAVSIFLAYLASKLLKDASLRGEFIQASYRSSAALLGIAIITGIYGTSGKGPLMIAASVPLYNICAVVVLSLFSKENKGLDRAVMKKTLIGVGTNPILIGVVLGFAAFLIHLPLPNIILKTLSNIGSTSSPMGLMAMGAMFDLSKAKGQLKPAMAASFLKLFGFCLLFLPVAVMLGFRNDALVAILIMLGSATTVASFVMANNMGHEGVLSSSVVMITTLLCSVSLTFWLFVLKTMSLI